MSAVPRLGAASRRCAGAQACPCRRANRTDCEHFLDKNIEVKLKSEGVSDAPAIKKRQTELRAQLQEDVDNCVGRRITDGMLTCVDRAEIDKDIDKCLR